MKFWHSCMEEALCFIPNR